MELSQRQHGLITRRRFLLGATAAVAMAGCGRLNRMLSAPELPPETARRYVWPKRPNPAEWASAGLTVSWIGHATFLLRLNGSTILTDPAFSSRVGLRPLGLFTLGPRRIIPPALALQDLPKLDLVLLSHAHMDHTDRPSLHRLPSRPPVILAYDTSEFVDDLGFDQKEELHWRETAEVNGVRIEALKVNHYGRRYPWDRNRGYNAYLVSKEGLTVLFAGDSAYTDLIARALQGRRVDVAIVGIGAYNPWIRNHANPEQAWRMFQDTGARYLIPMHWRTFVVSDEPIFEPIERVKRAAGPAAGRIVLDSIGPTWSLPG
ncbi:MAG: MBL fold metallo-hydrolase [Rhodothermales bacterium]|nr:MBL fold metallo-hydrolase [Rhodothermales bacterium]